MMSPLTNCCYQTVFTLSFSNLKHYLLFMAISVLAFISSSCEASALIWNRPSSLAALSVVAAYWLTPRVSTSLQTLLCCLHRLLLREFTHDIWGNMTPSLMSGLWTPPESDCGCRWRLKRNKLGSFHHNLGCCFLRFVIISTESRELKRMPCFWLVFVYLLLCMHAI